LVSWMNHSKRIMHVAYSDGYGPLNCKPTSVMLLKIRTVIHVE
jgi:hypothetical protein